MPFALVKETGSGSNAGANSYADLDDATAYHAASISGAAWTGAAGDKEVALVQARRTLDSLCPWPGSRMLAKQPLGWPRRGATQDGVPLDCDLVPLLVVAATCELARILLLSGDPTQEPDSDGTVSSETIGPLVTEYRAPAGYGDKSAQLDQALPRSVMAILRPLLVGVGSTGGTRFALTMRV